MDFSLAVTRKYEIQATTPNENIAANKSTWVATVSFQLSNLIARTRGILLRSATPTGVFGPCSSGPNQQQRDKLNQNERRIVSGDANESYCNGETFRARARPLLHWIRGVDSHTGLTWPKGAASPTLNVITFGGVFVGVPAALRIGVVFEHLRDRSKTRHS